MTEQERLEFRNRSPRAKHSPIVYWLDRLRRGSLDAYVAVLLSLATNLESLHVDGSLNEPFPGGDTYDFVHFLIESAVRAREVGDPEPRQRFTQLCAVRLTGPSVGNLTQWVRLPSLRSFKGTVDISRLSQVGFAQQQNTGITQLDLVCEYPFIIQTTTRLNNYELSRILERTPNLKSLRCVFLCTAEEPVKNDPLPNALLGVKDTLQVLEVCFHGNSQPHQPASFGSLDQFSRLTHIIADGSIMLPAEGPHVWQLPPCIQSLKLRNVNVKGKAKLDRFLDALDQLAKDVETGSYIALHEVVLSIMTGWDVMTDVLWPRAAPRLQDIGRRLQRVQVELMWQANRMCIVSNAHHVQDCNILKLEGGLEKVCGR